MKKIFLALFLTLPLCACGKSSKPLYEITWKNWDDSVIDTTKVEEGTIPAHSNPERESDNQYYYVFDSWEPEIIPAVSDTTYKATYTQHKRKFKITFDANGGKFLNGESTFVCDNIDGKSIVYNDVIDLTKIEIPTKTSESHIYTFSGWVDTNGNSVTSYNVTKNTTFKAAYKEEIKKFTVTYNAGEGHFSGGPEDKTREFTVEYGKTLKESEAIPSEEPQREKDGMYNYTFVQWNFDIENAKIIDNTTVYAYYSSSARKYEITFLAGANGHFSNGTTSITKEFSAGEYPSLDISPTYDSSLDNEVVFCGWDPQMEIVTSDKTYTALYKKPICQELTFTFNFDSRNNDFGLGFEYNGILLNVDWGDNTTNDYLNNIHTYSEDYSCTNITVSIKGCFESLQLGEQPSGFYNKNDCVLTAELKGEWYEVPNNLFKNCSNLTQVTLDEKITKIGEGAFYGCSFLSSINVDNITKIGIDAFFGVTSESLITIDESYEDMDKQTWYLKSSTNDHFALLYVGENVKNDSFTYINEDCNIISDWVYSGASRIEYFTIQKKLKYIGANAFNNCSNLQWTNGDAENLLGIYDCAFTNCGNLNNSFFQNILTDSLEVLEGMPFDEQTIKDSNLISESGEGISYLKTADGIEYFALYKVESNYTLHIENTCKVIMRDAFLNLQESIDLDIPKSVTYIDENIAEKTPVPFFYITLDEENPNYCGANQIVDKKTGKLLIAGSNVSEIDENANRICKYAIRTSYELYIPDSIYYIEPNAINENVSLNRIFISASIFGISNNSITNRDSIDTLIVESGSPYFESYENYNSLINKRTHELIMATHGTDVVSSRVRSIAESSFYELTSTSLVFQEGVEIIKRSAFSNFHFTKFVFPSSLKEIDEIAFTGGHELTEIYIPSSVKIIEYAGFFSVPVLGIINCGASKKPSGWHESFCVTCSEVVPVITYNVEPPVETL